MLLTVSLGCFLTGRTPAVCSIPAKSHGKVLRIVNRGCQIVRSAISKSFAMESTNKTETGVLGVRKDLSPADFTDLMFESKVAAILAATKWRPRIQPILIWHLAFLKLLPFFRLHDARIVVFLHGIEAWRQRTG